VDGENPAMPFTYQSGEEIQKGDCVLFHGEPGEIEFVADARIGDPAMDWYVEEHDVGTNLPQNEVKRAILSQPGKPFLTKVQSISIYSLGVEHVAPSWVL
jgi:hypothetical protein